jgi:hypothetical protein
MAFGGGTSPPHMLPKPTVAKTSRPLGKLSVPKPQGAAPRPAPSSTCCGRK